MNITTSHRWTSEPFDAAGEAVAAWVAARLTQVAPALPGGDRVALHVATPDSGSREALAFWRAANTTGFALAAPGAFPWTLSNSVTAWPRSAASAANDMPAAPPPTTAIFFLRAAGLASNSISRQARGLTRQVAIRLVKI